MLRSLPLVVVLALTALLALACPPRPPGGGEGEGEGEGDAAEGEGEGDAAEGEGEGDAGEGEGEGEGDAGEGEGEGEGEGDGGPPCATNDDCALGTICLDDACTPGCTENRDCPESAPLCDAAAPPNGACVVCLADTDCAASEICFEGSCAVACADDVDCPGQVCDVVDGVCVDCLVDDNCALGTICEAESCVAGCRQDRDCPEGEVCDESVEPNGACVVGCTTNPVDDCPAGTHCEGIACVLGCNGDDARCGPDAICVDDACQQACVDGADCPQNETCLAGGCVAGCSADADCPFTAPVCDLAGGSPGECVQCVADDDCPSFGGFVPQCDEAARVCRVACGGQNGDFCLGQVCDADDGLCVDCASDADCDVAGGETCDPVSRTCVAPPPDPLATLCEPCAADDDCGGAGTQCVRIQRSANPANVETACGRDCSDGSACPSGFGCELVSDENGVVVGQQCVPANSVVEFPTCDAYRDAVNEAACFTQLGALCGFDQPNAGDGVCLPPDAQSAQGVCTLPCGVDADCPAGFACEAVTFPGFPVENACVAP